ncbi:FadR/GntR family transcriptional regulator [Mycetocola tolaasinivorans]|uniref:FadR/GntR family transcriptional regulator n=1 Tax=Mycetocola tolaasinivorans TaxID=76635 RepID=UPI0015FFE921|nr:GntR family transcriptional regulator [Mycetocola tolaasinivorans]
MSTSSPENPATEHPQGAASGPDSAATSPVTPRPHTVSQRIAADIRARIDSGEWTPGTRIPTEMTLAKTHGVGRGSVREALRSLSHAGLLEARAGDGTYVRARSELQVQITRRIQPDRLNDLFELRDLFERHTARGAARNATAADHAELARALAERDAATSIEAYIAHDARFHEIIVRSAGNALLTELYTSLDAVAAQLDSLPAAAGDIEAFRALAERTPDSHHDLLDAIVAHDPARAERIAARLIECARSLHDTVRPEISLP